MIYKYTPESDLNQLLVELRTSAVGLYKEYKIPNKFMSLMDKIFSKRNDTEDFRLVSLQLVRSFQQLFDYLKEKENQSFVVIDAVTKEFLLKFFKEFLFKLMIDEFFSLIIKKIKRID